MNKWRQEHNRITGTQKRRKPREWEIEDEDKQIHIRFISLEKHFRGQITNPLVPCHPRYWSTLIQGFPSIWLHRTNYYIIRHHSIAIFITLSMKLNYKIVHLKFLHFLVFLKKKKKAPYLKGWKKKYISEPQLATIWKKANPFRKGAPGENANSQSCVMCRAISAFSYQLKASIESQVPATVPQR